MFPGFRVTAETTLLRALDDVHPSQTELAIVQAGIIVYRGRAPLTGFARSVAICALERASPLTD